MEDFLTRMIADQRAFQERVDPRPFTGDVSEQIAYVKDMLLALYREIGECLDETTWKPWATGEKAIHRGNLMTELTDAWCFLCNVWFAVMPNATPAQVAQAMAVNHDVKVQLNHKRQDEGYDGKHKCPHCSRALDDPGLPGAKLDENGVAMCLSCRGTWQAA
jgi:dUTPase-like protein